MHIHAHAGLIVLEAAEDNPGHNRVSAAIKCTTWLTVHYAGYIGAVPVNQQHRYTAPLYLQANMAQEKARCIAWD